MSGSLYPAEAGGGATAADPLAVTLPLLRALPAPAVLFHLDGTIVAASPAMEDLLRSTVDGMSSPEFVVRLGICYPMGRDRSWSDLHRALACERNPAVAIDVYDSNGRFHALVATASRVGPDDEPIGVLIVFFEVPRFIERSAGSARDPPIRSRPR